jgi:hypothetical protein
MSIVPVLIHGTEACDCQMVILLIYAGGHTPASVLVHSFQKSTWLYLVDTAEQPVDQSLEMLIQETLIQPSLIKNDNSGEAHALA